MKSIPDRARVALATIRLTIGTTALLTPKVLARRLGVDPDANPQALYALRLFGVRTVVLGGELLFLKDDRRTEALRVAIGIHAADAAAAVAAGVSRQLPPRAAVTGAFISSVNTALAIAAQKK